MQNKEYNFKLEPLPTANNIVATKRIMTTLNEQPATNNEFSLGEHFRVAREKLQLSLDDVSKQLNLRPTILQLLEHNEFTHKSIPATFMKGYIRSYAKFLRLPDEVWATAIALMDENTQHDLGKNARSTKAVNQYSSHGRWVGYITILVLLIAAGMTALWWWENYQKSNQERDTFVQNYVETTPTNVVETHQVEPVVGNTLVVPVDNSPITSSNENNFVETQHNMANEEPVVEKTTRLSTAEQEQSAVQNPQEIVVAKNAETESVPTNSEPVVSGDLQIEIIGPSCWISVKDVKRKVLAQKEYKQGEILTFNEGAPYSLIIGAPSNVKITYKGEYYPLKVDGRVAKFKLQ